MDSYLLCRKLIIPLKVAHYKWPTRDDARSEGIDGASECSTTMGLTNRKICQIYTNILQIIGFVLENLSKVVDILNSDFRAVCSW